MNGVVQGWERNREKDQSMAHTKNRGKSNFKGYGIILVANEPSPLDGYNHQMFYLQTLPIVGHLVVSSSSRSFKRRVIVVVATIFDVISALLLVRFSFIVIIFEQRKILNGTCNKM